MTMNNKPLLIETDSFPVEFLSELAERESWRKEVHRPVYHVHKWWAKRLGSVFRGILLGCVLPEGEQLATEFYRRHSFSDVSVFDPFLGSGTTVGEAHKLGFAALGRDINRVAIRAVRTAFGPMDEAKLRSAFATLSEGVGARIRKLYQSVDSKGCRCDVLYHFWVMQAHCPSCDTANDLFPSWVIARNAYPNRKPEIQVLCPSCGDIFPSLHGQHEAVCRKCRHTFDPEQGSVNRATATCRGCEEPFKVIEAIAAKDTRPDFRLYGKLVLTKTDAKEYLPTSEDDLRAYRESSARLREEEAKGSIRLPTLRLQDGYNTRQAMGYCFHAWRDFFNDRQLLALGWLHAAIHEIRDEPTREALLTLFSGVLEFNNLFASYKGEGTGAVRHMFSHHVLKPERAPIEANIWGTARSSGSFSTLFKSRLLRAVDYKQAPTEIGPNGEKMGRECSPAFSGRLEAWPTKKPFEGRAIYLSCGDSSATSLPERSVDLVVTDPPFFDNVHYSELADFFYAWQQIEPERQETDRTTRSRDEVQDSDSEGFSRKLRGVFEECHRVLKDGGLLAFTYHHSRDEGWTALAQAIFGAGFVVVNSQPVKSEMSVATPKAQAKDPIQLDIVLVCRKASDSRLPPPPSIEGMVASAKAKLHRLATVGLKLSGNDRRIVLFGQLLGLVRTMDDAERMASLIESNSAAVLAEDLEQEVTRALPKSKGPEQLRAF
jgi:putative DNA methylase